MHISKFFITLTALAALLCCVSCSNDTEKSVSVAAVTFEPDGGAVSYGTELTLSCATANTTIWYATEMPFYPTNYQNGTQYTASIPLSENCTVYAVAVDASGNVSARSQATFTVLQKENTALYLGNPSGAKTDESLTENYLIEREAYSLSYNNSTHNPNWVAWHFCASDMGSESRSDSFTVDPDLPDTFYKVQKSDYQYSTYGFDRGHMCPSSARTTTETLNKMTFYMTNMVPQTGENNQKVWAGLESYEKTLCNAGNELYIISGPYGTGGSSSYGSFDYIVLSGTTDNGIVVPAYTWKIILVLSEDSDDLSRVDGDTTVIAVMIPNTLTCLSQLSGTKYASQDVAWKAYTTTIDDIEEKTGYDFFANLPDKIEEVLEQK